MIANIPAEIRTEHLANITSKRYSYTNLLDTKYVKGNKDSIKTMIGNIVEHCGIVHN
jgi:hypothetical protein